MRRMKDSGIPWINKMPSDWDLVKTKRRFYSIKQIVGSNANKYERLALTLKGIIKRSKDDNNGLQPEKFEGYQILHKNDIVLKLIDLENLKTSRVGLSSYTGIVSPAYIILSNKSKDNRFYYYWFMFMYHNQIFNNLGGIGVRSSLNIKDVLSIQIPSINKLEQSRIADYLDNKCEKINDIIRKQKEIIDKLKEYKTSLITEAVTKGLNPDAPMKDSGIEWIGKIPKTWNNIKIRHIVYDIGDIEHYMPKSVDRGIPYLMTGDLNDVLSDVKFENCKQVSYEDFLRLSQKVKVKKGDLIFARYATIGTVCLVDIDKDCLISYSCVVIKPNFNFMNSKFLMYYYKSVAFSEEIKQYSNYNTQDNIGKEAMYRTKICLPTINEQMQIVEFLDKKCDQIDDIIKKKQALVEKLTEYKKSLIYELVTGKKEV